jgi:hypothetical protein
MPAPITFDPAAWKAAFPVFANVADPQAQFFFDQATLICSNEACGNMVNFQPAGVDFLKNALWLLTAHIAWLQSPRDASGQPSSSGTISPIVGVITNASEGSVSVGASIGDVNAGSPSQAWFMQTQWGATYWTIMAGTRTAQYVPAPFPYGRAIPPAYTGRGRWRGGWG